MEVPTKSAAVSRHRKHKLIPCSYEDYQKAIENEIPICWRQAMKAFNESPFYYACKSFYFKILSLRFFRYYNNINFEASTMKKVLILMLFALHTSVWQVLQFTGYMFNRIYYNPGVAGSGDAICINALHRSQVGGEVFDWGSNLTKSECQYTAGHL
ncbi:MAG: type IX secretion system membrane protein PorP/SprF [Owenweeksia sp.]|nr:type IX secretion system membrane protein PorP/SprF [Owenweeksia sp.]